MSKWLGTRDDLVVECGLLDDVDLSDGVDDEARDEIFCPRSPHPVTERTRCLHDKEPS